MSWINRNLIVECLQELSDQKFQQEVWLSTGGDKVSSFVEVVEQLFTDSGLGDELEKGTAGLGREVEDNLMLLDQELSKINRKQQALEIIKDPRMESIRNIAAKILLLLEEKE